MRFDIDNQELYCRNEATHWGNPLVLQRMYKYTLTAPQHQIGSATLILLQGSVEELIKSSEFFSFVGGTTCSFISKGFLWQTKGGKPEIIAFATHVSGVLPTRKWLSNRPIGDSSLKVLNLVAALSEGCRFYKRSNSACPAVVSAVPNLNGHGQHA